MSQPRPTGLIAIAVVLAAVIITAVVLLASRPSPVPEARPAVPAAAAPEAPAEALNAVTWHDQPLPGPLLTVFQDAAGKDTTLGAFKGKVAVVNFWATWCAPCIKEMPTLNALQREMGTAGVQVVAISQDREGAKVTGPFIAKNEWKDAAYFNEPKGVFQKEAKMRGLPTTIILNKAGQEVGRLEGTTDWTAKDVKDALAKLTAAP